MKQRNFRMIETNGIRLEGGRGGQRPVAGVCCTAFRSAGYLWRNQIDELVAAGYQVAVPDQRGYGGSDKPADIDAYDIVQLCADAAGIADALGHETFTLVTHDWGAIVGWYIALLYPQRVKAVFALSVPPTVGLHAGAITHQENFGDNFVYVVYFQQPGVAEAELDADVRKSLRMMDYAVSGDAPAGLYLRPKPASSKMLDGLIDPDPLPSWLTEDDLDYYVEAYRDGFRGPINWYRNIDRSMELTRHLEGVRITQPSHFMVGSLDPVAALLADAFANLRAKRAQPARQRGPRRRRPLASAGAPKRNQCRVAGVPWRARQLIPPLPMTYQIESRQGHMAVLNLKNKQVLITGAGSGIGRAAALAFARRGANIVAADINPDALAAVEQEVEALGVSCWTHVVDVADESAMKQFADLVQHELGAIDVLVNNAGVAYMGLFLHSDLDHWARVLNVNIMGVVHGCRYFIPAMIAAGGQRQVLNVASSAGIYPGPSLAAYSASKYAVTGFTEVLKMELKNTGVGVTTVFPGIINTAIVASDATVSPSVPRDQLERLRAHYQAKGCPPDVVAEKMVRATQKGADICLTDRTAVLLYHVKRVSQKLTRRLMMSSAKKVGYL